MDFDDEEPTLRGFDPVQVWRTAQKIEIELEQAILSPLKKCTRASVGIAVHYDLLSRIASVFVRCGRCRFTFGPRYPGEEDQRPVVELNQETIDDAIDHEERARFVAFSIADRMLSTPCRCMQQKP